MEKSIAKVEGFVCPNCLDTRKEKGVYGTTVCHVCKKHNNPTISKQGMAELLALFIKEHGYEDAGKLLSRTLVGIAHNTGSGTIEFKDDIGEVLIKPIRIPREKIH